MDHQNVLNFWGKLASNNPTAKTSKVNPVNDFTQLDADFIMKFANANTNILDLASGSGIAISKICDNVKHIVAVELFEEFTKFIRKTDRITIENQDIRFYTPNSTFDLITMFGIVQYFNNDEVKDIYNKYHGYLNANGRLIIKGQFGVKENVQVAGYSEELKENYYSLYRHIDYEVKLLGSLGYKNVQPFDIYPPECNRWDNTHFYAIVAEK